MTDKELQVMLNHFNQRIADLEKECRTFMATSQAMLRTCRNLEERLSSVEDRPPF